MSVRLRYKQDIGKRKGGKEMSIKEQALKEYSETTCKNQMYTVNLCKCPYCGSYHYEVGYFTSAANCKCLDCSSLFWFDFSI